MNWKGRGKKRSLHNLKYEPDMFLEQLRKATKNLSGWLVSGA
jgi:hypothetical protein